MLKTILTLCSSLGTLHSPTCIFFFWHFLFSDLLSSFLFSSHLFSSLTIPTSSFGSLTSFLPQDLRKNTSRYYFVPQHLHKALPGAALYSEACAEFFPGLLCATKLVRSPSQYYFVLQDLHKALPDIICNTNIAQSTSKYYFARQSLHAVPPSITLYYKACTN